MARSGSRVARSGGVTAAATRMAAATAGVAATTTTGMAAAATAALATSQGALRDEISTGQREREQCCKNRFPETLHDQSSSRRGREWDS